jgi:hypothetical protein
LLRRLLIAYGVLCLIGALVLLVLHVTVVLVIYLAINGLIITAGIFLERSSYRSKADTTQGKWQSTGERFNDPTSGKLIEVYYNPQTGERDYRESEAQK